MAVEFAARGLRRSVDNEVKGRHATDLRFSFKGVRRLGEKWIHQV
jgi:hypothetical protein